MKTRHTVSAIVLALCFFALALHAEVLLINRDSKKHDIVISVDLSGSSCYGKQRKFTLEANKTVKAESGWICIDNSGRPFLLRDGKRYEIKNGVAYPIWD